MGLQKSNKEKEDEYISNLSKIESEKDEQIQILESQLESVKFNSEEIKKVYDQERASSVSLSKFQDQEKQLNNLQEQHQEKIVLVSSLETTLEKLTENIREEKGTNRNLQGKLDKAMRTIN